MSGNSRGRRRGRRTAETMNEDDDNNQDINRDNPSPENNTDNNNRDNERADDLSLVSLLFIDKKLGFACYKVNFLSTWLPYIIEAIQLCLGIDQRNNLWYIRG